MVETEYSYLESFEKFVNDAEKRHLEGGIPFIKSNNSCDYDNNSRVDSKNVMTIYYNEKKEKINPP